MEIRFGESVRISKSLSWYQETKWFWMFQENRTRLVGRNIVKQILISYGSCAVMKKAVSTGGMSFLSLEMYSQKLYMGSPY